MFIAKKTPLRIRRIGAALCFTHAIGVHVAMNLSLSRLDLRPPIAEGPLPESAIRPQSAPFVNSAYLHIIYDLLTLIQS
jgi:hypothetical protein